MKNNPFPVGATVVVIDPKKWDDMKVGDKFIVIDSWWSDCGCGAVDIGRVGGDVCSLHNRVHPKRNGRNHKCFVLYKQYSDATAEILEKFKPVEETADHPVRVIETVNN